MNNDYNYSADNTVLFPPLPLEAWKETKETLHLYLQIIGKINLACSPPVNHWWHITFRPTATGLTTGPMPYRHLLFEINFDFIQHELIITTSEGARKVIDLEDGLTVAHFYKAVFSSLSDLGIVVKILAEPYDHKSKEPFETDTRHAAYDKTYINRFWQVISQITPVFQQYRGQFTGKSSPVQLFWHSFDLAVNRFSGRPAPLGSGNHVADNAYSHEVISVGFWTGDDNISMPAFYGYVYPEPKQLMAEPLQPQEAYWYTRPTGGAMAILNYDDLRQASSPHETLLDFLESVFRAGAKLATNWNMADFKPR